MKWIIFCPRKPILPHHPLIIRAKHLTEPFSFEFIRHLNVIETCLRMSAAMSGEIWDGILLMVWASISEREIEETKQKCNNRKVSAFSQFWLPFLKQKIQKMQKLNKGKRKGFGFNKLNGVPEVSNNAKTSSLWNLTATWIKEVPGVKADGRPSNAQSSSVSNLRR